MLRMLAEILAALALLAIVACASAYAGDDADCNKTKAAVETGQGPGPLALVGVGIPLGIADYFLQDLGHESMHCGSVELVGGHCKGITIVPGVNANGTVYLGETSWTGNLSKGQEVFVLLAPKILDLTLMGGYAALRETNSLPQNKWGQLALVVAATGGLLDFSKHFVLRNKDNDVERSYTLMGVDSGARRVPFEILYGATIAAGAYEVGRGWIQLFSQQPGSGSKEPRQLTKYGSPLIGAGTFGWQGEF